VRGDAPPATDVLAALDEAAHLVVLRVLLLRVAGGSRNHGKPQSHPQYGYHDDEYDPGRAS
jgi:hypothetical protein